MGFGLGAPAASAEEEEKMKNSLSAFAKRGLTLLDHTNESKLTLSNMRKCLQHEAYPTSDKVSWVVGKLKSIPGLHPQHMILDRRLDPTEQDSPRGRTLLEEVCFQGLFDILRLLLIERDAVEKVYREH